MGNNCHLLAARPATLPSPPLRNGCAVAQTFIALPCQQSQQKQWQLVCVPLCVALKMRTRIRIRNRLRTGMRIRMQIVTQNEATFVPVTSTDTATDAETETETDIDTGADLSGKLRRWCCSMPHSISATTYPASQQLMLLSCTAAIRATDSSNTDPVVRSRTPPSGVSAALNFIHLTVAAQRLDTQLCIHGKKRLGD